MTIWFNWNDIKGKELHHIHAPPIPKSVGANIVTTGCHYWHLSDSSQNTGAKAKCLLRFSYSYLYDMTNCVTEIPNVRVQVPGWRAMYSCIYGGPYRSGEMAVHTTFSPNKGWPSGFQWKNTSKQQPAPAETHWSTLTQTHMHTCKHICPIWHSYQGSLFSELTLHYNMHSGFTSDISPNSIFLCRSTHFITSQNVLVSE